MRDENADKVKIAPSILSADFARLGEHVAQAADAGADYIHVDVMDGRFVPNITIGALVVEAIRSLTELPLDVHLMTVEPEKLVPAFVSAGSDIITVHAEACTHLHRVIYQIKDLGARAGVAINPATPIDAVAEVLSDVDLVLVMSVNPGFPAQKFIPGSLDKITRLRSILDSKDARAELEVDGGIKAHNASSVVGAGARVLVVGSAIYNQERSVEANLALVRESI